LGNVTLDQTTLAQRGGEIAAWSAALAANADLLIYGCDVAAGSAGEKLVGDLAALTGADVAASTDATGSALLGGNWVLEQASGPIEATVAVDSATQQAWVGLLGIEFQVNTTTSNDQTTAALNRGSQQAVALDAAGNFVVVWSSQNQDGNRDGVYARRFAANGTPLTGEVLVNTTTAGAQNQARVASDTAGNFVVTWTSDGQDGNQTGVYARRFAANGTALTGEIAVNTTTTGAQANSVIGMNRSTGAFVVAWQGQGSGDSAGIFFRRFSANGGAIDATELGANTADAGNEQNPAVAMDSTGAFVIAFDVNNHTYFQRFNAGGIAQGGLTQVDTPLSSNGGAAIAMDAAGNFTIVYRENSALVPGVWGRGFNADGTQSYFFFYVDSGDATSPSIAMADDGRFIVTYEKTGSDNLDVRVRKFAANGSPEAAAFSVHQYVTSDQQQASIALRDMDNFVVVWSGKSAADSNGVVAKVFEANLAPTATSLSSAETYAEDTPLNLADIVVTDLDSGSVTVTLSLSDVAAGSLNTGTAGTVTSTYVPGTGVWRANGPIAGVNSLLAGLIFTPGLNYNSGFSIASSVSDGVAPALTGSKAMTGTAINDAPVGTSKTVTTNEDTAYTFSVADFGFTDPNDAPANTLANVKVTTLPGAGSLTLSGAAVAAGQFVSAANISAGNLRFTPAANAGGTGYAAFTFQVQDNGGTTGGGVDLDVTARTMTVNVTALNDAPVGTSKTVTTNEDTAYTFTVADFGFTDPNDTPANTLASVKVTTLPGAGTLKNNGVNVTTGQVVSRTDINTGKLVFTPLANSNGAGYASFTFQVSDNGGTADGGVNLDATPRRPGREPDRHQYRQARLYPASQRQRRRLRQLHFPGKRQRRHRRRRSQPRRDTENNDRQRHRGQRRTDFEPAIGPEHRQQQPVGVFSTGRESGFGRRHRRRHQPGADRTDGGERGTYLERDSRVDIFDRDRFGGFEHDPHRYRRQYRRSAQRPALRSHIWLFGQYHVHGWHQRSWQYRRRRTREQRRICHHQRLLCQYRACSVGREQPGSDAGRPGVRLRYRRHGPAPWPSQRSGPGCVQRHRRDGRRQFQRCMAIQHRQRGRLERLRQPRYRRSTPAGRRRQYVHTLPGERELERHGSKRPDFPRLGSDFGSRRQCSRHHRQRRRQCVQCRAGQCRRRSRRRQ